jgi:hypothetical protein
MGRIIIKLDDEAIVLNMLVESIRSWIILIEKLYDLKYFECTQKLYKPKKKTVEARISLPIVSDRESISSSEIP